MKHLPHRPSSLQLELDPGESLFFHSKAGSALISTDEPGALVEIEMLTHGDAAERLGIQNVGDIERVARTTLGAALVAGAAAAPRPLRWPLRLAGVFAAATGIAGWCPAYSAAGVTSLGGPGDRPDEAERAAWLASRTSAAAVSDEGTGA